MNFCTWLRKGDAGCTDPCDCAELSCGSDCPPCEETEKKNGSYRHASIDYVNLTKEDVKYIEAVRRGQTEVYGPMLKLEFLKKFPDTVVRDNVWRRDKDCGFTKFDIKRKGNKSDSGWLGEGVYFYGSYEDAFEEFAFGWCLRPFYINVTRHFVIDKITRDRIAKFNMSGVSKDVTKITDEYDGVFYNGDMKEEWCVRRPSNIKLAEATFDDQGRVIPLSYRFNPDDPDFRY